MNKMAVVVMTIFSGVLGCEAFAVRPMERLAHEIHTFDPRNLRRFSPDAADVLGAFQGFREKNSVFVSVYPRVKDIFIAAGQDKSLKHLTWADVSGVSKKYAETSETIPYQMLRDKGVDAFTAAHSLRSLPDASR